MPAPAQATAREWIGLAVLALPCLIYSMDLTVLYLALPQIAEQLRPSSAQLLWIVDIYGFLLAGFLVTMGTLGDRIGRRRLLMIGAAAFGAASVLAAFSTSAEMLIASRALLGVTAATLSPSTLSLIRNMFLDEAQRGFAIGVWVAAFSAGGILGPLFGGLLLEHYWWGSVFLIAVPAMLLLLVLGPLLLPEFRDENAGRLDLASAVLATTAVLSVIYGIKRLAEGGLAAIPLLAVVLGALLAAAFLRRQRRLADPMIDVRLFAEPRFGAALACNIITMFVAFGFFLFIAQYFQLVLGLSPLEAGLWTLPSGIVFVFGSLAGPPLARRLGVGQVIAGGLGLSVLGFALLTQLGALPFGWLMLGYTVFCLGLAPIGALTTGLVMSAVAPERAGVASGMSETSFEFGGALGIAVLGSIVTALYRGGIDTSLPAGLPPAALDAARDTLGGAVGAARELGAAGEPMLAAARTVYTRTLEQAAWLCGGLSLAGMAVIIALRRRLEGPAPIA
ncbi:MFS transporter [Arenimonas caeni]|uniref:MFS transporter n=1 Tax=Arenimonas caeni TaxID=2058085 RepID=A0A2P6M832_9GAMM|nr:MFS transporter [Arenimonas caeni]PRH82157.1 MFS transporter [Arenimonas caeni]